MYLFNSLYNFIAEILTFSSFRYERDRWAALRFSPFLLARSLNLPFQAVVCSGSDENRQLSNESEVLNSPNGSDIVDTSSLGSRLRLHAETHVSRSKASSDQIQYVIRLLQQLLKYDIQNPCVRLNILL